MIARFNAPLRVAAVAGAASVIAAAMVSPAYAADGNVDVVNTETVQVYTSPTGQVQTRRVYEQLALTGKGAVDLHNPISTDNLRNLDGFGGFDVKDGEQITRTTVDGEKKLRSVSDYNGKLPLNVSVQYLLDGKNVKPGDVVGESGKLKVQYTVENVTGSPQEVSFPDGKGGTVTKTVDVPVPMVGSLTTVAPPNFTNVSSDQANLAGDGKGGTKMSFTMTLFPPIGSTTAVFGYTADITDGVVPRAEISALPVNPLKSPTFATAATSYKGGADTGARLADGAGEIDANLLKLRDGAGDLLAGLIKLRDGAGELNAGLAGKAAPGSKKLAQGASDLNDGLGQLNSGSKRLAAGTGELLAGTDTLSAGTKKLKAGANKLSAGAGKLSDGASTAASGSKKLYAGTQDLSAGATKVSAGATKVDGFMKQIATGQGDLLSGLKLLESGVQVLPDSVKAQLAKDAQYQALLGGMQSVVDGIGAVGRPGTMLDGLNTLKLGLTNPASTQADCAAKDTTKCGATDALDFISFKLGVAMNGPASIDGTVAKLVATVKSLAGLCANPTCVATINGTADAIGAAQTTSLTDLKDGVDTVSGGIKSKVTNTGAGIDQLAGALNNPGANPVCSVGAGTATKADDCGVQQAVAFFKASIPTLVDGITASIRTSLLTGISAPVGGCLDTSKTLICGASKLALGGSGLAVGTGDLAAGAGDLSAGASLLSSKTGELSAGLGKIDDGAGQLSDGAGRLAAGTDELNAGAGKLNAGAGKLDDGAGQLADGTGKASAGSQQLADGAGELATGLQDAADGSGRLVGGLGQAADGAPKIVDGAQKLSDQGTKKLIEAGTTTAQSYGEMYATMTAGAERAQTEDMAFGAPEDAIGLTAYSYVIKGNDGEGGRNLARGVGGLAILGAGGAVFALRRRLI